jgi:hypothetical protein
MTSRSSSRGRSKSQESTGTTDHNFMRSSAREKVLEHLFIGQLLRTLWCAGVYDVEVLRSEVDDCGYNLVVECNGILRHVQLKSTFSGAKTGRQNINIRIAQKPSGCVVWIVFAAATLSLETFIWFGGKPGMKISSLGERVGWHTKGNSEGLKAFRANIRVIGKAQFRKIGSMGELVRELFGEVAAAGKSA